MRRSRFHLWDEPQERDRFYGLLKRGRVILSKELLLKEKRSDRYDLERSHPPADHAAVPGK